jgi:hypothetical protein
MLHFVQQDVNRVGVGLHLRVFVMTIQQQHAHHAIPLSLISMGLSVMSTLPGIIWKSRYSKLPPNMIYGPRRQELVIKH